MTPIVSGTTVDRIVRTCAITVMVVLFCGWFLYDGHAAWPRENLEKAVQALEPVPDELPEMNDAVTPAASEALLEELEQKRGTSERLTRGDIEERFGPPGWEQREDGTVEWYYFGGAGVLRLQLRGEVMADGTFVNGYHDHVELMTQLIFGYALLPFAAIMLIQVVRVLRTRVVLSDEGLRMGRRPTIPFEAMTGLDASAYQAKGYMVLKYQEHRSERRVRLDSYVIREFSSIVSQICRRRGFENPLKPGTVEDDASEPSESASV
jgi:hypothetical protein